MVGSVDTGSDSGAGAPAWALAESSHRDTPRKRFFLRTWRPLRRAAYSPSPDRSAGAGNMQAAGGCRARGNHGGGRSRPGWRTHATSDGSVAVCPAPATALVTARIHGSCAEVARRGGHRRRHGCRRRGVDCQPVHLSHVLIHWRCCSGRPGRRWRGRFCSPHSAATPRRAWPLATLSDSSAGP